MRIPKSYARRTRLTRRGGRRRSDTKIKERVGTRGAPPERDRTRAKMRHRAISSGAPGRKCASSRPCRGPQPGRRRARAVGLGQRSGPGGWCACSRPARAPQQAPGDSCASSPPRAACRAGASTQPQSAGAPRRIALGSAQDGLGGQGALHHPRLLGAHATQIAARSATPAPSSGEAAKRAASRSGGSRKDQPTSFSSPSRETPS